MTVPDARRWAGFYAKRPMGFPSENVVRIYRGAFRPLAIEPRRLRGRRICDIGFGDGRNLLMLSETGMRLYGTEVSPRIVALAAGRLRARGVRAKLAVGTNLRLPYPNGTFDHLLAWQTPCYVERAGDFPPQVAEAARVLKRGGMLVAAMPMRSNYVFERSCAEGRGYRRISERSGSVQHGQLYRCFSSRRELRQAYARLFKHIRIATVRDDLFGQRWHHFIIVAVKK